MSPKERAHANKYAYNFKCTLMHNTLLNEKRTEAKQTDPMFNLIMETLFAAGRSWIFSLDDFHFPRILAVGSSTFLKARDN